MIGHRRHQRVPKAVLTVAFWPVPEADRDADGGPGRVREVEVGGRTDAADRRLDGISARDCVGGERLGQLAGPVRGADDVDRAAAERAAGGAAGAKK